MAHAEYPESFRCPLSRSLMRDPVTAADGHSYERGNIVHAPIKPCIMELSERFSPPSGAAVYAPVHRTEAEPLGGERCWLVSRSAGNEDCSEQEEWFAKRQGAALTSPVTGLRLPSRALVANITLRKSMQEFFAQQKKQRRVWTNGRDRPGGWGSAGDGVAASTAPSGLWNIPETQLELGDLIDKGSFGEVRRGVLVGDDGEKIPVAVKLLLVQTQAEERDMFEKELQVLHRAAMRCQHACRLYGTCVKQGKLALVMKLYTQSLDRLMRKQPQRCFVPADAVRYSLEMARAIAELHACAIIIQDLKPANILLDEFENIVVADFGLSAVIEGTRLGTRTVKGTFNYMAPEAFDPIGHGGLTVKADCWSWACCVIELFSGRPPWENDRMAVIMQKVLVGKRIPEVPREVPAQLADVLRRCFSRTATSRPSFVEMLPVLQQVLSGVSIGGSAPADWPRPEPQPYAPAVQPRLVMHPAKQPVNAGDVEQARQPGHLGRPYAAGKNVGQWVEERRRERDARPARGAAPDVRAADDWRRPLGADAAASSQATQDEWIEYKDPKTGRPYYYNKTTKKTEWRIPKRPDVPAAEPALLHLQPSTDGGASRFGERRVGFAAEEQLTHGKENAGPRLVPARAAVGQAPYQSQTQPAGGRPLFTRTGDAPDASRLAATELDVSKAQNTRQVQLLRTAQQRMAAMLATSSDESMRASSTGPARSSTTTEESSSSVRSPTSVSELKAETRKVQSMLRDVQNEIERLRDAKTEAVRTGKLPGDAPSDARRKVLSGDAEELWRSEQAALLDVRRNLYSRKRELCRLCREEEGLGTGAMAKAQEEYDEILLMLRDQREERDLLKFEQQCLWLTDDESAIRYLEHVQLQVAEREDELANVVALERETLERQQATSRGSSSSGGGASMGGSNPSLGSSRAASERSPPDSTEEAHSFPMQLPNAPPGSIETIMPKPQPRSPMQVAGDREMVFGFGGRGAGALHSNLPAARDTGWDRSAGGGDAGVLARARAMVAERNAQAAGRS